MKKAIKIFGIGVIFLVVLTVFVSSVIGTIKSDSANANLAIESIIVEDSGCPCNNPLKTLETVQDEQHNQIQTDPNCPFGPIECCWWECTFTRRGEEKNCWDAYQVLLEMYEFLYKAGGIDEVQYQMLKDGAEEAYNDCMHDAMVRWAECIIGCANVVINQQTQHGLK